MGKGSDLRLTEPGSDISTRADCRLVVMIVNRNNMMSDCKPIAAMWCDVFGVLEDKLLV